MGLTGALLVLLGAVVLAGWALEVEALTRVARRFPPMQSGTAIGFAAVGAAMLALHWRRLALARGLSACAMGVGAGALAAQLAGLDAVGDPGVFALGTGSDAVRLLPLMASNTTVAFILISLSLILTGRRGGRPSAPGSLAGLCALGALVLGGVSLGASVTGTGLAPFWPYSADMAVHTALAFVAAGGVLFTQAWRSRTNGADPRLDLPPVLVVMVSTSLTAVLWMNLEKAEHRYTDAITRANATSTSQALARVLDEQLAEITRLAARFPQLAGSRDPDPAALMLSGGGDLNLALADGARRIVLTSGEPGSPLREGADLDHDPLHRQAALLVLRGDQVAASPAVRLPGGGYGRYVYAPVRAQDPSLGLLIGLFDLDAAFERLLHGEGTRGYATLIRHGGRPVFGSRPGVSAPLHHVVTQPIDALGGRWDMQMWPLSSLLEQEYSSLPDVVLALGVALGILLGTSTRTRQQLAASNSALEARVALRTRALEEEMKRREELARELAHAAEHDALTGLPNRRLFQSELALALARADRHGRQVAVMFLDLDRFKEINDSYGHHAGDVLLAAFAQRVRSCLRHHDVVARQGGDEFLVLVEEIDGQQSAADVAEKIGLAMQEPIPLDGRSVVVASSIGIALYPQHGRRPETLITHADAALYQAKGRARGSYAFYSEQVHAAARARTALRARLQDALDHRRLRVAYQPRVSLKTRTIVGAEALVRWPRGKGEGVPPDEFIPLAEESGQIAQLGEQVLDYVMRDLERWRGQGLPLPCLSINVSARQLSQPKSAERFLHCLVHYRHLASHIELELTERVLMDVQSESGAALLHEIFSLGYRIAIDDFGTGYSSLTYLRSFPIDTIKIDRSFVRNVRSNASDATIAQSVIDLARNFQMLSVAEGVETAEQADFLAQRGCDEAQGFWFSRPLPPPQFLRLWRSRARFAPGEA